MTLPSPTQTLDRAALAAWREQRTRAVLAPLGTASLVDTHWLTTDPTASAQAPGLWRIDDGSVVGTGLGATRLAAVTPADGASGEPELRDEWRLDPGAEITDGSRVFRAFARGTDRALRVFDPEASTRAILDGIDAYEPADLWVRPGTFVPAEATETFVQKTIDGATSDASFAGTIALSLPDVDGGPDEAVVLTVTWSGARLSAVFGDTTNGSETYRFRFLGIDAPAADGSVVVDFNRAFLPPCAFSDHYICPFPPAGNRFGVPVRAGERAPIREGKPVIAAH